MSIQAFFSPKGPGHRKNLAKWKKALTAEDPLLNDPKEDDLVIVIMGPTGVGKSTFINNYFGKTVVEVGGDLESCTQNITYSTEILPLDHPTHPGRRLVLVDTPGFDDTTVSDYEILRRISVWLATVYDNRTTVAGVIYLNNISSRRMHGSTRMNFEMFQGICGKDASAKVVMATTHWDVVPLTVAATREVQFQTTFWKDILNRGAYLMRIQDARDPRRIIDHILMQDSGATAPDRFRQLRIQEELIDLNKKIPATEAGKSLRLSLKELKDIQIFLRNGETDPEKRREYADKEIRVERQLKQLELDATIFHRLRNLCRSSRSS